MTVFFLTSKEPLVFQIHPRVIRIEKGNSVTKEFLRTEEGPSPVNLVRSIKSEE